MRPIAKLFLTATLTAAACRAIPQRETQERADARGYSETRVQEEMNLAATSAEPMLARQKAVAAGDAPLFLRSSVAAGMVIRTGQTSIEVDSLERAVSQIRLLAGRLCGGGAPHNQAAGR